VQQDPRGSTLFSMQYQVLARKWRPKTFAEVVGQAHVSRTLLNALQSGRVAHAFLFSGPRGSGKTTMARILAKALNCHAGKTGEPCSNCPSCVEIAAGNCMDVLEIDAASNRGIDEIRELKEKARYNPARDRHKIFIIDEVHMLTSEAFNALLKTLEEPPPRVVFILATTEYHKIPATILSRCQQYSFKLIQYPLIMQRLSEISIAEGVEISTIALEQVVFSSGGSMRDAMSALDQVIAFSGSTVHDEDVATLLGLVEPKVLSQTVRAIAGNDIAPLLKVVADLVEVGQDLTNFCRRLSGQFRNLMVLKAGIADPALLGIPESLLPELRAQADLFSREDLLRLFDAFQKIETGMRYATQVRFQLEMGLIELAHIAKLRPIEELIAEFSGDAAAYAEGESPREAAPPASNRAAMSSAPPANPGFTKGNSRTAAAPAKEKFAPPEPERTAPSVPPPPVAEAPIVAPVADPRDLLFKIAAAIGRESLESVLQHFEGASLKDNQVVLLPGAANEFARRQVKDNLPAITQAAGRVLGGKVKVLVSEPEAKPVAASRSVPDNQPDSSDLLEKVKREPIVKSFLDVFPGLVKAEKIDK
jgi:DNA polymerase III subunit gamma/tau